MHENSSELYEQIRRNLAFLRKEHEIKQTTIAKELKTEQSMISQYETGKRVPSLDLLERWCKCLNVSPQALFFSDLQQEKNRDQKSSSIYDMIQPIAKCTYTTYHLYFVNDENSDKNLLADEIKFRVDGKQNANSAPVVWKIKDKKGEIEVAGRITMDASYAYAECHDDSHDLFMHLTYFYYRTALNPIYNGGLGVLQRMDAHRNPIVQFCAISREEVSGNCLSKLGNFLRSCSEASANEKKQPASNKTMIRLTKKLDQTCYYLIRKKT